MKRIFDLEYPNFIKFSKSEFLNSLKISNGRSVCAEVSVTTSPLLKGISNPVTASAFGADLVTLHGFDFDTPFIQGYDDIEVDLFSDLSQNIKEISQKIEKNAMDPKYIQKFKALVGRFIGVSLIPVSESVPFSEGSRLSQRNLMQFKRYSFDYLVITNHESIVVTNDDILRGIRDTRKKLGQNVLIIAGKSFNLDQEMSYEDAVQFITTSGADVILVPAPGTLPEFTDKRIHKLIQTIHAHDCLAMTFINSGQEDATPKQIETLALSSKMAGADILHIGPNGPGGMASVENLLSFSITIRGKQNTYAQIARSKQRK